MTHPPAFWIGTAQTTARDATHLLAASCNLLEYAAGDRRADEARRILTRALRDAEEAFRILVRETTPPTDPETHV
jgi:hypothetical protein